MWPNKHFDIHLLIFLRSLNPALFIFQQSLHIAALTPHPHPTPPLSTHLKRCNAFRQVCILSTLEGGYMATHLYASRYSTCILKFTPSNISLCFGETHTR